MFERGDVSVFFFFYSIFMNKARRLPLPKRESLKKKKKTFRCIQLAFIFFFLFERFSIFFSYFFVFVGGEEGFLLGGGEIL